MKNDLTIDTDERPYRVGLLVSNYRGAAMLSRLLKLQEEARNLEGTKNTITGKPVRQIELGFLGSDSPTLEGYTNAKVRFYSRLPTNHPSIPLVVDLAKKRGLTVHTERVLSPGFQQAFVDAELDACFMAVYGQKIPKELINAVPDFFNYHSTQPVPWPAYGGPDPFGLMESQGKEWGVIAQHRVVEKIDMGDLYSYSAPFLIDKSSFEQTLKNAARAAADIFELQIRMETGLPIREGLQHLVDIYPLTDHERVKPPNKAYYTPSLS